MKDKNIRRGINEEIRKRNQTSNNNLFEQGDSDERIECDGNYERSFLPEFAELGVITLDAKADPPIEDLSEQINFALFEDVRFDIGDIVRWGCSVLKKYKIISFEQKELHETMVVMVTMRDLTDGKEYRTWISDISKSRT